MAYTSVKLRNNTDGLVYTIQDDGIVATTGAPSTLRASLNRMAKARTREDMHGVADLPVWVWPEAISPEKLHTLPKQADDMDTNDGPRRLTPYRASLRANQATIALFETYSPQRHDVILAGTKSVDAALSKSVVDPLLDASKAVNLATTEAEAKAAKARLGGLTNSVAVNSPTPAEAAPVLTPPPKK